jgi:esterase/lipase
MGVLGALTGSVDLVVAGLSLGGLTIPVLAGLRPVSRMVYLCAMLLLVERVLMTAGAAAGRGRCRE